jgi:predicted nucleic acid-binding protein
MILLDTNIISELMLIEPERVVQEWLNRQPRFSVWTTSITVFEMRFGLLAMPEGKRCALG